MRRFVLVPLVFTREVVGLSLFTKKWGRSYEKFFCSAVIETTVYREVRAPSRSFLKYYLVGPVPWPVPVRLLVSGLALFVELRSVLFLRRYVGYFYLDGIYEEDVLPWKSHLMVYFSGEAKPKNHLAS